MESTAERPSGSPLEKLPLHLLVFICECLAQHQPSTRRSLFAFSLTSKACCEATDRERFRHIHLAIAGPKKLQRDIQRCCQILETSCRSRFVRSVQISGATISPAAEDNNPASKSQVAIPDRPEGDWGDEDEEEPKLFSGLDRPTSVTDIWKPPSRKWPDEKAWQPLVNLLHDLPALQDVIYASKDRLPRLLLSELDEHHPRCRLHMHYFRLPSLIHSELADQAIHPNDIALATSPCLYSIVTTTQPYDSAKIVDYNEEAILAMIQGLAPRLTNVSLTRGFHQAQPGVFATIPRPQWKGSPFPGGTVDDRRSSTGHLENLAINGLGMTGEGILRWSRRTDFCHLHSLHFGSEFDLSAVRKLTEISRQTPLARLSSLHLRVAAFNALGASELEVDPAVAELLQSLRPLEVLKLTGSVGEKSFEAITTHHTTRLRDLNFVSQATKELDAFRPSTEQNDQLYWICPKLKKQEVGCIMTKPGIFNWVDSSDSSD